MAHWWAAVRMFFKMHLPTRHWCCESFRWRITLSSIKNTEHIDCTVWPTIPIIIIEQKSTTCHLSTDDQTMAKSSINRGSCQIGAPWYESSPKKLVKRPRRIFRRFSCQGHTYHAFARRISNILDTCYRTPPREDVYIYIHHSSR